MVENVLVRYIDPYYICKYGIKPREMAVTVAKEYLKKNLIELIPTENGEAIPKEELRQDVPKEEPVEAVADETPFTRIAWVPTPEGVSDIISSGKELGFSTAEMDENTFSHSAIFVSELVVLDTSFFNLSPAYRNYLKSMIFQSRKPFVLSVRSSQVLEDIMLARQLILESRGVIFLESEFEMWLDQLGEIITNWSFYTDNDALWRIVQSAILEK